ncbi:DUF6221 family protein [Streptomyces coeruleorubidus]|uniref:DUF6221 family protein n=1 Tax=Streptomyces coeruleorubidus TaxID=116188 RepID=UPI00199B4A32|nr:DUF6221 family protein [Streptomyces coeruleorubidus]GGT74946.1 hypothetical protein GCM10010256_37240 [Streptomyces coeruleorubidus]
MDRDAADLVSFLSARLDEDDAAARAVKGEGSGALSARVLADVAAKRGLLRFVECQQRNAGAGDFMVHGPAMVMLAALKPVLRHLATAYVDHPNFDPEWEPNEDEYEPDERYSTRSRE